MSKPRFWTTKVDAGQTASEISELIRKYGCKRFMVEWDDEGDPVSLEFVMRVPDVGNVPVRLAAQHEGILRRLTSPHYMPDRITQAKRIAWRQLKAWVEITLETAENKVKPFHQLFMSDVVLKEGGTVGEMFEGKAQQLLGSGS